jgi:hypothetical protein
MPLSSSSVDRRIPEALSTSRGKPAGVSDGNWIETTPGGVDRARETDNEDRGREDAVPVVNSRNAQNIFAPHARANDANLEGQNPGKQENQEVVHYGEAQIRRREI